jgi:hypothetical protein
LAQLLAIDRENVDIFSVQLRQQRPPITDVRFSAHGSPYYKPIKLNGIVLQHREEVRFMEICPPFFKTPLKLNVFFPLIFIDRLKLKWVST